MKKSFCGVMVDAWQIVAGGHQESKNGVQVKNNLISTYKNDNVILAGKIIVMVNQP